jgi:hypothetical protein
MKQKNEDDFVIRIPKKLYTKELQKMFEYLRHKKGTSSSKATQKGVDNLIETVRKTGNEKKLEQQYL